MTVTAFSFPCSETTIACGQRTSWSNNRPKLHIKMLWKMKHIWNRMDQNI